MKYIERQKVVGTCILLTDAYYIVNLMYNRTELENLSDLTTTISSFHLPRYLPSYISHPLVSSSHFMPLRQDGIRT